MTQVHLQDIVGYTQASDRISVHMPTVKRHSPAELLLLAIKITTPAPLKKQPPPQQQLWLHVVEVVTVGVANDLMVSSIQITALQCPRRLPVKELYLPPRIPSLHL